MAKVTPVYGTYLFSDYKYPAKNDYMESPNYERVFPEKSYCTLIFTKTKVKEIPNKTCNYDHFKLYCFNLWYLFYRNLYWAKNGLIEICLIYL